MLGLFLADLFAFTFYISQFSRIFSRIFASISSLIIYSISVQFSWMLLISPSKQTLLFSYPPFTYT